jgi:hypothetical protein
MLATVRSHAMVSVTLSVVALTKPIVNCSVTSVPVRVVIGARTMSNFGS